MLLRLLQVAAMIFSVKYASSNLKKNMRGENAVVYTKDVHLNMREEVSPNVKEIPTEISAGKEATRNDWPFMALLGRMKDGQKIWFCDGSLISESWVLTAGHCLLQGVDFVRLGEHDLSWNEPGRQPEDFLVDEFKWYPGYQKEYEFHDIGLVKLRLYEPLSKRHQVLSLPWEEPKRHQYVGKEGIVIGWGAHNYTTVGDNPLKEVRLTLFEADKCHNSYSEEIANFSSNWPDGMNSDLILCGGHLTDKENACQGNAGSPLVVEEEGRYLLLGIASTGYGCGNPKYPGVYIPIFKLPYLSWIINNVYVLWDEEVSSYEARFWGEGYSIFGTRFLNEGSEFLIKISIKTLAEEGLILLLSEGREYLSLEMSEGKVIYRENFGSKKTKLITSEQYNDDKWHTVKVIKAFGTVIFLVDSTDSKITLPDGSGRDFLEKTPTSLYIGGVPHGHLFLHLTNKGFVGSIKNAEVGGQKIDFFWNRESFAISPVSQNKTSGRKTPVKLVALNWPKPGFVRLQRQGLENDTKVKFSFKTSSEFGVLLYKESKDGRSSWDLFLEMGELGLNIVQNNGFPETFKGLKSSCNDGEWHTVTMESAIKGTDSTFVFRLEVDNEEKILENPFGKGLDGDILLGGSQVQTRRSGSTFICFTNVSLAGQALDFESIPEKDRPGFALRECPAKGIDAPTDNCLMPPDQGTCANLTTATYYDKLDGVCKEFLYGGCGGNSNNFQSTQECTARCGNAQDVCLLPMSSGGPCNEAKEVWYFDTRSKKCLPFMYSGCRGNANRFETLGLCQKHCPN